MQPHAIGSNSLAPSALTRHALTGAQNVARMSSLEIAELTGKKHFHVMRDIREMLKALEIDEKGYIQNWIHPQNGQAYSEFTLPKDLTLTLVSGYNVKMRYAITQRWLELEVQQAPIIPQTLPDALRLAAELAESNKRLQQQVAEQGEIVDAFDRIALAKGSLTITSAAKHLGIGPKQLIKWMNANRWIYQPKAKRPWLGFQPRIDAGLLEHKVTVIGTDANGEDFLASQVRITAKGLTVLSQKLGKVAV